LTILITLFMSFGFAKQCYDLFYVESLFEITKKSHAKYEESFQVQNPYLQTKNVSQPEKIELLQKYDAEIRKLMIDGELQIKDVAFAKVHKVTNKENNQEYYLFYAGENFYLFSTNKEVAPQIWQGENGIGFLANSNRKLENSDFIFYYENGNVSIAPRYTKENLNPNNDLVQSLKSPYAKDLIFSHQKAVEEFLQQSHLTVESLDKLMIERVKVMNQNEQAFLLHHGESTYYFAKPDLIMPGKSWGKLDNSTFRGLHAKEDVKLLAEDGFIMYLQGDKIVDSRQIIRKPAVEDLPSSLREIYSLHEASLQKYAKSGAMHFSSLQNQGFEIARSLYTEKFYLALGVKNGSDWLMLDPKTSESFLLSEADVSLHGRVFEFEFFHKVKVEESIGFQQGQRLSTASNPAVKSSIPMQLYRLELMLKREFHEAELKTIIQLLTAAAPNRSICEIKRMQKVRPRP